MNTPGRQSQVSIKSPEGLSDGVGAQVDDLDQVISGAGEQLSPVVVQVQRRHSAQQLQLPHDTLRSDPQQQEEADTHRQC